MAASKCQCDPDMKKMWGCEGSTQDAVWIDVEDDEYFICPMRLLTNDIIDWYDAYTYYQEHSGSPTYDLQSGKYIEAWKLYRYYLNHYTEEMTPKGNDGYATARQLLKGKKNG